MMIPRVKTTFINKRSDSAINYMRKSIDKIKAKGQEAIDLSTKIINTIQYLLVDKSFLDLHTDYFEMQFSALGIEDIDAAVFIKTIQHFSRHQSGGYFNSFCQGGINRTTSIQRILRELNSLGENDDIPNQVFPKIILEAIVLINDPTPANYISFLRASGQDMSVFYTNQRNASDKDIRSLFLSTGSEAALKTLADVLFNLKNLNQKGHWGEHFLNGLVWHGRTDILKYVLPMGIFQYHDKEALLDLAIYSNSSNNNLREFLIETGAKINLANLEGNTLLHTIASQFEHRKGFIELLVKHGADVNIQNHKGDTPLHIAAQNGSSNNCKALIMAGADLNIVNKAGDTPLHITIEKLKSSISSELDQIYKLLTISFAKKSNNLNIQDNKGDTPLHKIASQFKYAKGLIELFVERGANVNLQNHKGETPLHIAFEHGRSNNCRELILADADLNIVNKAGKKPLQVASEKADFPVECPYGASRDIYLAEELRARHYEPQQIAGTTLTTEKAPAWRAEYLAEHLKEAKKSLDPFLIKDLSNIVIAYLQGNAENEGIEWQVPSKSS